MQIKKVKTKNELQWKSNNGPPIFRDWSNLSFKEIMCRCYFCAYARGKYIDHSEIEFLYRWQYQFGSREFVFYKKGLKLAKFEGIYSGVLYSSSGKGVKT